MASLLYPQKTYIGEAPVPSFPGNSEYVQEGENFLKLNVGFAFCHGYTRKGIGLGEERSLVALDLLKQLIRYPET